MYPVGVRAFAQEMVDAKERSSTKRARPGGEAHVVGGNLCAQAIGRNHWRRRVAERGKEEAFRTEKQ